MIVVVTFLGVIVVTLRLKNNPASIETSKGSGMNLHLQESHQKHNIVCNCVY